MVHAIPPLDAAGLRRFGWTTGAIIAVLFGLFFPWVLSLDTPVWPWVVGGVLVVWAVVHPGSLDPVYHLWMRFGLLLNRITTPVVLGLVFFGLFTPLALGMRLFGRDSLQLKRDRTIRSYRKASKARGKESMEKPY